MTVGYIYRVYDRRGRLLYIGCTTSVSTRLAYHRTGADWWPRARDWRVRLYPSIERAQAVEARAIRRLKPEFNVIHQVDERERMARAPGFGWISRERRAAKLAELA